MLEKLFAGRPLARNTIWNLMGEGAPLLVGLIAIPILVHALGTARFGILLIAWMLIGHLSLFNLGVGRALTNLVAQKVATDEEESVPPLIWTANLLMLGLGVLAGVVLAACSHWLVYSLLKIPAALQRESLISFYILSCAMPMVVVSSGIRGVLEAYQRFDAANAVRIPTGIFSFAGPLAVLPFSHSLVPVVVVLAAGRYLGVISYFIVGRILLPVMRAAPAWDSGSIRPLLSFGGWMTVSRIVGPILSDMDRVFVGAILSMQAVAYYATPYEIVTKLIIIPTALGGVLFPAFSGSLLVNVKYTQEVYRLAQRTLAAVMIPVILLIVFGGRFGLRIWLGPNFAAHSTLALQILAGGILIKVWSYAPSALVQGAGRPDWLAKLRAAEAPAYVAALWFLTVLFGIAGTATAWAIRAAIETLGVLVMAEVVLRRSASGVGMRGRATVVDGVPLDTEEID